VQPPNDLQSTDPPHPGVRFPPPLIFVATFLAGLAAQRWITRLQIPRVAALPWLFAAVGWAMIAVAFGLFMWAGQTFGRAGTSMLPFRPASRLVRSGPYRFTRNPMYVSLSVLYFGLALLFDLVWPLVLWPVAVAVLHHFVIRREERYLSSAFGQEYGAYRQAVRRWL
jgi:protein-S-isoprenylcysteine O-methyltransferase Ste14